MAPASGAFSPFHRIEPMVPRDSDGIDFTLYGSTTWLTYDAEVTFLARHVGARRLLITELEIAGVEIGRKMLGDLPIDELISAILEWVVVDGTPLPAMDLPAHRMWSERREAYVALAAQPGRVDGPKRGRPVDRDDEYLEQLAADYVRLSLERPRDPRKALSEERHKGAAGVASDLELAREAGWLAPTTGRGDRRPRAGERLIERWNRDGYPTWHPKSTSRRNR